MKRIARDWRVVFAFRALVHSPLVRVCVPVGKGPTVATDSVSNGVCVYCCLEVQGPRAFVGVFACGLIFSSLTK